MCIFQHKAYTVLYNPHAMHIFLCVVVRNICPCCSFIVVQSLSSKTFCTQQAWWAILANWGDEADQNLALHKWQAMQTRNCATKGTKLSGRILKPQPDKNCVAEDGSTPLVIYTLSHKYTDCGLATVLPSGKPLHRQSWGSSFLGKCTSRVTWRYKSLSASKVQTKETLRDRNANQLNQDGRENPRS